MDSATSRDSARTPGRPSPRPSPGSIAPLQPAFRPPSGQRNLLPVIALVLIVVAIASTVYALITLPAGKKSHPAAARSTGVASTTGSSTTAAGSSTASQPAASPASRAVAWLGSSVGKDAPIAAPPAIAARLRALSFTAVTDLGADAPATGWIVYGTGPGTGSGAAISTIAQRAVSVARFQAAGGSTSIGYLIAGATSAHRDAVVASDQRNRLSPDAALAVNPAVQADAAIRARLRSGGLDARPATLLALLASMATVHVLSMPVDPAEAAVGRPARTLVLDTSTATLRAAQAQMPASDRPVTMSTTDGRTTLVWHVAVDPVHAVS